MYENRSMVPIIDESKSRDKRRRNDSKMLDHHSNRIQDHLDYTWSRALSFMPWTKENKRFIFINRMRFD